jgi:hypothetical protein
MFARALQACGAAAVQCLGAGVISDIYAPIGNYLNIKFLLFGNVLKSSICKLIYLSFTR